MPSAMPNMQLEAEPTLVPKLIDGRAYSEPDRLFCAIPRSTDLKDGLRCITYRHFANAVNKCAWWIEKELGKGENFETLAYVGPSDIRYAIITLAAVKTGHKALLTSPRNTVPAQLGLFEATQCQTLLAPTDFPALTPAINAISSKTQIRILHVASLEELLDNEATPPYPFEMSLPEAKYNPYVVLHTSGSTGLPKAVTLTHGAIAALYWHTQPRKILADARPTQLDMWQNTCVFLALPPFHMVGILMLTAMNVYWNFTPIMGPSTTLATADVADQFHGLELCQGSILAPSMLEAISKKPEQLERLRRLKFVLWTGGPFSSAAVADKIRSYVPIYCATGSTETGAMLLTLEDQEDYDYMSFSALMGCEFRYHSDDLYEMVIVRDRKLEAAQYVFFNFPELSEWPTKDLYSKHPSKPGLWRYRGRSDDIIVLANGLKLNPLSMEGIVMSHPDVVSALITGHARTQTAVLLEMKEPPATINDASRKIEELWPTIEQANREGSAQGRIAKDFITFTTKEKPMLRAGKGTVQRRLTIEAYRDELDTLYSESRDQPARQAQSSLDTHDLQTLQGTLGTLIKQIAGLEFDSVSDDFFAYGMDSLHVINLAKQINGSIATTGKSRPLIEPKFVYANPSIEKLAAAVLSHLQTDSVNGAHVSDIGTNRMSKMQGLLEKYTADLPITARPPTVQKGEPLTVVLTGSTGSLGPFLLDALLTNSNVTKIYCLNRSANGEERQKSQNSSKALSSNWSPERVEFLQSDFSKPYLGLRLSNYFTLLSATTHIIHNAWPVDFNLSLSSFATPHVSGVRQLVDFSSRSRKNAHIFFISTVSTVTAWNANHAGPVPEAVFADFSVPEAMGYAESKHVTERLLDAANKVAGIPCTIVRVGQIAGPIDPKHGIWNKREWLPSLIASSKFLGKIPGDLGAIDMVDWIPVDVMGKVLVELLINDRDADEASPSHSSKKEVSATRVYHAVNPNPIPWPSLLPTIVQSLQPSAPNIEIVPFSTWVAALRASVSSTTTAINLNPALKLLSFFESVQKNGSAAGSSFSQGLETKKTVERSEGLKGLGEMREEWMRGWMEGWGF